MTLAKTILFLPFGDKVPISSHKFPWLVNAKRLAASTIKLSERIPNSRVAVSHDGCMQSAEFPLIGIYPVVVGLKRLQIVKEAPLDQSTCKCQIVRLKSLRIGPANCTIDFVNEVSIYVSSLKSYGPPPVD